LAAAAVAAAAVGFAADLAVDFTAGSAGAAGFGNDSRSLRTTGASMVDEADLTNSPNS
jgi:hypothetical protein